MAANFEHSFFHAVLHRFFSECIFVFDSFFDFLFKCPGTWCVCVCVFCLIFGLVAFLFIFVFNFPTLSCFVCFVFMRVFYDLMERSVMRRQKRRLLSCFFFHLTEFYETRFDCSRSDREWNEWYRVLTSFLATSIGAWKQVYCAFFLPSSTEFNPIRIKVYWLQTMHPSKKVIFPSFNLVSIKTIKRKELEWNDWSTTGPILGYVLPIKFVAESRMEFLKSTNHVTVRILVFQTFPLEECRSSGGGHRILLFRFCFLSFFFLRLCLKKLSWKNRENQRKLRRDPVRSLQYRLRRIDYESHWWMALHGVIHQPRICNSKERGRFFICFLFDSFLCV